jgi:hypothetical protein
MIHAPRHEALLPVSVFWKERNGRTEGRRRNVKGNKGRKEVKEGRIVKEGRVKE